MNDAKWPILVFVIAVFLILVSNCVQKPEVSPYSPTLTPKPTVTMPTSSILPTRMPTSVPSGTPVTSTSPKTDHSPSPSETPTTTATSMPTLPPTATAPPGPLTDAETNSPSPTLLFFVAVILFLTALLLTLGKIE